MSRFARDERAALCSTLLQVGPEAPTLARGWSARDLAAHLVIRERRPDAALGVLVPRLAGHTRTVQERVAAQEWTRLVELVRTGPPRWSPTGWGPAHEAVNLFEMLVHHEDLRRGGAGWSPRELDPALETLLWARLRRMAPILLRRVPAAVTLERAPGSDAISVGSRKKGRITVRGPVQEVVLYAFGRSGAARVEVTGVPSLVEQLPDTLGI